MDEVKLSDDTLEQIKDFDYRNLTEEQKSLIDKLILNEELKFRYRQYGLCYECNRLKSALLCNYCLQSNFQNWTSGNHDVDEFIQKAQLKTKCYKQVIEWIEHDGFMKWDYSYDRWKRVVESTLLARASGYIVRCFGITKDQKTNNFMMMMDLKDGSLRQHLNNNFISLDWERKLDYVIKKIYGVLPYVAPEVLRGKEYLLKRPKTNELCNSMVKLFDDIDYDQKDSTIYKQVVEANEINKKLPLTFQSTLLSTGTLSYTTHLQAVCTSRLLDFKNLPEQKNADNNETENLY
ncbi:hypothetical protein RclHR1_03140004 [Rhizophagus clarus]|uniref:Uncharacterized protein n=1 Tax=Rhizophagus clarus TaxID=94130 RepID=A0A2Z6R7D8_9GLOM|nr:hypothetical protein RclHR1_03140004 [Rhizophagus clarus]